MISSAPMTGSISGSSMPVVADRIELGTYMLAPAIAGGTVELLGGRLDLISAFVEKLDEAGVQVTETPDGFKLTPYDAAFAAQMEAAEKVMRENRDALRVLAK